MAVTGLIMIAYLLAHMAGNLKIFLGAESFNHYAEWLHGLTEDGGLAYPLLPAGWFLWIFRAVLLLCILGHMHAALMLTRRDHAARPAQYANTKRLAQTYSARTMRWGGVILLLFIIFHLLQFTARVVKTGFTATSTPAEMFVASFSQPWVVLLYAIAMIAVCMHVRHAVWSSLTTLGLNTSERSRSVLNGLAMIIAILLFVGFLSAPLAVLFGWIH